MSNKVNAIIFAAGNGKRMWPYNLHNKCTLRVGNKPLICHTLEHLKNLGCATITVVVKQGDRHLYPFQKDYFFKIRETRNEGTLTNLLTDFPETNFDHTLLLHGDVLVDHQDLQEMFYLAEMNDCGLLTTSFGTELVTNHIGVEVDNGIIKKLMGHPRSHYVNARVAGVFSINQSFLTAGKLSPGYFDNGPVGAMNPFENQIEIGFNLLAKTTKVLAVKATKPVFDLDHPFDLLKANQSWAFVTTNAQDTPLHLEGTAQVSDEATLHGNVQIGDNSVVSKNTTIGKNVVIGKNVRIAEFAKIHDYSVIGDDCVVGYLAEFSGVLLNGVKLYHQCEISGVVGEGTDIAAGVTCGTLKFNDRPERVHTKNQVFNVVGCGGATYFGNHVRTGVGVMTMPGVIIGNYCALWPGLVVAKNIPDNKLAVVEQKISYRDWGPEKYGW